MAIRTKVTGTDLVIKNLRELGARFPRKVISQSARVAAKPVQTEAKARAPVLKKENRRKHTVRGLLRRNIKIRALKKSRVRAGVIVRTGTRQEMKLAQKGNSYYPAAMEYGWVPARAKDGRKRYAKPGFRFMRGAWGAKRQEVRRIFLREMLKRLQKEAKALPKRAAA